MHPLTPSLTIVALCGLFLIAVAHFALRNPEKKRPSKTGKPVTQAYSEMIDIIYKAEKYSDLVCLTALINDFFVEYTSVLSKEDIYTYIDDILEEKKIKIVELCQVNQKIKYAKTTQNQ